MCVFQISKFEEEKYHNTTIVFYEFDLILTHCPYEKLRQRGVVIYYILWLIFIFSFILAHHKDDNDIVVFVTLDSVVAE